MSFLKTSALLVVLLLSCPVLAQAQANTSGVALQQSVLDELKAMRSSLERLEKGQRALLAVLSIQVNEGRVSLLEEQRKRLAAEEQDLDIQIRQTTNELRNIDGGGLAILATGQGQEAAIRAAVRDRQDQAGRRIDEVRRNLQAVDQQIATLRTQIAVLEKQLADAMK